MPRIGALVSAYYAAPFLSRRLDNLAGQSLHTDHPGSLTVCVICQWGSEEHTIAEDWADHNEDFLPVVIVTTGDVPTVYEAWNRGIEFLGEMDYFTNANSDDLLDPDGLAALVGALEADPGAALAYGNLRVTEEINGPVRGVIRSPESGYQDLLRKCYIGPCPVWRASLHDTYGLFDGSLQVAGDYDFWLRLARAGERFVHVDQIVGTYAYRKASREHREPVRALWENAQVRARYREGV